MDAATAGNSRARWRHALAGLQAGVSGTLWMLACFAIAAEWNRRSFWLVPNLFATTFFGPNAYRNQFSRTSASGIALMLAIYGCGGIIWGLMWRDERKPFLAVIGAITGLLVYILFFDVIWKYANPLMTLYAPERQLQIGHLLWGMLLARSPGYSRRIALATTDPALPPPLPQALTAAETQEAAEVRSGDTIE